MDDDLTPAEDETLDDALGEADDLGESDEGAELDEPLAARPGRGRLWLAILASVAVAVVGIAAWAILYVKLEREYIGVIVLTGLLIGYAMRAVSQRTTLGVRIISVLITAVAGVVGAYTATVAWAQHEASRIFIERGHPELGKSFWTMWTEGLDKAGKVLGERKWFAWVVFALAAVIAYFAAAPQKPKKEKEPKDEPAGWDVPPAEFADDAAEAGEPEETDADQSAT